MPFPYTFPFYFHDVRKIVKHFARRSGGAIGLPRVLPMFGLCPKGYVLGIDGECHRQGYVLHSNGQWCPPTWIFAIETNKYISPREKRERIKKRGW